MALHVPMPPAVPATPIDPVARACSGCRVAKAAAAGAVADIGREQGQWHPRRGEVERGQVMRARGTPAPLK